MFERAQAIFMGIPAIYVLVATGFVGLLIGVIWIRRITQGDSEPQNFLATADRPVGPSSMRILDFALPGLVAIFLGFTVYVTGVPGIHSSIDLNALLLGVGVVLEAVAVLLGLRRLWGRSRG
jgi:hypothetical protein